MKQLRKGSLMRVNQRKQVFLDQPPRFPHLHHFHICLQSQFYFGAAIAGNWKDMALVDVDGPIQMACSLFRAPLFITPTLYLLKLGNEFKESSFFRRYEVLRTCERSGERGN